jgi:hypothetical protein
MLNDEQEVLRVERSHELCDNGVTPGDRNSKSSGKKQRHQIRIVDLPEIECRHAIRKVRDELGS